MMRAMKGPWRVLLLLLVAVLARLAVLEPGWNLDAVGYAGVGRAWLGESGPALHAAVYRDLHAWAAPSGAAEIASATGYRRALAENADNFTRQLPLYANKPLYTGLVAAALVLLGNSVHAAFSVSAWSYVAICVLLAFWSMRLLGAWLGLAFAACLIWLPPMREIGQLATPDATAALFAFLAIFLFAHARRPWAWACLFLSILARPDQLFLAAALAWWDQRSDGRPWARSAALIAALVAVALLVPLLTGAYSWKTVFVHTFAHALLSPADFASPSLSISQYVVAFGRGLYGDFVMHPSLLPAAAAVSIGCRVASGARGAGDERVRGLHAALWLSVLGHFVAFPMLADRFFSVVYLGIALSTVAWAARRELAGRAA
jgi:hypothetical protein